MQVGPRDLDDAKSEQRTERELPTVESGCHWMMRRASTTPVAAVQVSNGWINSVPCCVDPVRLYSDFSFSAFLGRLADNQQLRPEQEGNLGFGWQLGRL